MRYTYVLFIHNINIHTLNLRNILDEDERMILCDMVYNCLLARITLQELTLAWILFISYRIITHYNRENRDQVLF